jgi:hypothetical protein
MVAEEKINRKDAYLSSSPFHQKRGFDSFSAFPEISVFVLSQARVFESLAFRPKGVNKTKMPSDEYLKNGS